MKFKVLRDLPVKVREKVRSKPDMNLEALTKLVAELKAMEVINASLRSNQNKVTKTGKAKWKRCRWQRRRERERRLTRRKGQAESCQIRHTRLDAGSVEVNTDVTTVKLTSQACFVSYVVWRRTMSPPSA